MLAPLASGSYAPLAAYHLHKDISRALQLAPGNPRVLLIDAISDYQLPPSSGGNKERALTKLRAAVAAFEAERRDTERLPGWGAAEARRVSRPRPARSPRRCGRRTRCHRKTP